MYIVVNHLNFYIFSTFYDSLPPSLLLSNDIKISTYDNKIEGREPRYTPYCTINQP